MLKDPNNINPGFPQDESTLDAKYAKYSTEQLEIVFTHALDPEEKERVKKELTKRYYRHYTSIAAKDLNPARTAADLPDDQEGKYAPVEDHPLSQTEDKTTAAVNPLLIVEEPNLAQALSDMEKQASCLSGGKPASEVREEQASDTAPINKEKNISKKFCFIATAAYGSPLAPEVVLLSSYRDNYLAHHLLGRKIIHLYYRLSPPLAAWVSRKKFLKTCTRWLLVPIIYILKSTPRN